MRVEDEESSGIEDKSEKELSDNRSPGNGKVRAIQNIYSVSNLELKRQRMKAQPSSKSPKKQVAAHHFLNPMQETSAKLSVSLFKPS